MVRQNLQDSVANLPPFVQATGKGDNLSPLIFSVLLKDLPRRMRRQKDLVKVLWYVNDLIIYGGNRFHVQQALR